MKNLDAFADQDRLRKIGNEVKELLYHYSHDKLEKVLGFEGMPQILSYFRANGTNDLDSDLSKALDIVLMRKEL